MTLKRIAPTAVASLFAIVYVIISPPSLDLAAHLLRAKLFSAEGFGLWNNWWYAGHHVPGYSVLFPPVAALLTPQVAGGLAAVGTAALFEALARGHFGDDAWLGALWFGAATATNLFTGRLTFAFGLLPAHAGWRSRCSAIAPDWPRSLAVLTALASPVAALFSALVGAAYAIAAYSRRRQFKTMLPGLSAIAGSLLPVLMLSVAFPEGGSEPFTFATLWPIPADRDRGADRPATGRGSRCGRASSVRDRSRGGVRVDDPGRQQRRSPGAAGRRPAGGPLWYKKHRAWLVAAGPAAAVAPVAGTDPRRPHLGRRPVGVGRVLPAAAVVPERADRTAVPGRDPVHALPLGGLRGGAPLPACPRLGAPARHQATTTSSTAAP